jgi:hypothetical protein
MLKIKIGNIYIFGLSDKNIERLKQGKPIRIDFESIGDEGDMFIFHAPTEIDMVEYIEDQLEIKLPEEYHKWAEEVSEKVKKGGDA